MGRAGRVSPGEYCGLIRRKDYEALPDLHEPEIQRVDLRQVLLSIGVMKTTDGIRKTLSQLLDPPSEKEVTFALRSLRDAGALKDENTVTTLGHFLESTPQCGILLLYGIIFKCLDPVLSMAALLNLKKTYFSLDRLDLEARNKACRHLRSKFGNDPDSAISDFLIMSNSYEEYMRQPISERIHFAQENFLDMEAIEEMSRSRKQMFNILRRRKGLLPESSSEDFIWDFSQNLALGGMYCWS